MPERFKKIKYMLKPLEDNPYKIFVIRHGSTDFNSEDKHRDRIRGWIDIPLNEQGKEEARLALRNLIGNLGEVDVIYCSDLTRTRQTANIVNSYYKAPIVYTKDLR